MRNHSPEIFFPFLGTFEEPDNSLNFCFFSLDLYLKNCIFFFLVIWFHITKGRQPSHDLQGSAVKQASTQISHEAQSDQQNSTSEGPVVDSGSVSSSNNETRKVSHQDIEFVR